MNGPIVDRDPPTKPILQIFAACCASPANGARAKLTARTTTSPIRRMGTSVGMAGGRIAEYDESQERVEVMRNAGSRARADPSLPPILGDGPARHLHLQPAARRARLVQQPGAQRVERAVVGRARAPGEAGGCAEEVVALFEHRATR